MLSPEATFLTKVAPVLGAVGAVQVTGTPIVIDLCSFPPSPALQAKADEAQANPVGKSIRVTAELASLYYVTGSNINALNNINSAAYSAVNSTTGKITVNGSETDVITIGRYKDFLIPSAASPQEEFTRGATSPARYLALVAGGTNATARFFQVGP